MTKNTKKPWQGRFSGETDKFVESFTSSIAFDKRLYEYDIQGSEAHSMMLNSIGILSDKELKDILSALEKIREKIEKLKFDKGLDEIINFADDINKKFNDHAPWNLKKEGKIDEMEQVLSDTAENIRKIAILLLPFLENSARVILDFLNINKNEQNFDNFSNKLKKGTKINEIEAVFPRIK